MLNGMQKLQQTNSFVSVKILALSFNSFSVFPIPKSLPNMSYAETWSSLAVFTPWFMLPFCLYDLAFPSLPVKICFVHLSSVSKSSKISRYSQSELITHFWASHVMVYVFLLQHFSWLYIVENLTNVSSPQTQRFFFFF